MFHLVISRVSDTQAILEISNPSQQSEVSECINYRVYVFTYSIY
jgi:hypothetical protein